MIVKREDDVIGVDITAEYIDQQNEMRKRHITANARPRRKIETPTRSDENIESRSNTIQITDENNTTKTLEQDN